MLSYRQLNKNETICNIQFKNAVLEKHTCRFSTSFHSFT